MDLFLNESNNWGAMVVGSGPEWPFGLPITLILSTKHFTHNQSNYQTILDIMLCQIAGVGELSNQKECLDA